MDRSLVVVRGVFAALYIVAGIVIVVEMAAFAPKAGFKIVVGVVLGAAMVALGVHRLFLIARLRSKA